LFAVDSWGNRILVFDAHPERLQNYPEAVTVIGQADFNSVRIGTSRKAINLGLKVAGIGITPGGPRGVGLSLDKQHQRLFVSEGGNARVTVFDVHPDRLQNQPEAIAVLGYSDFTTNPGNDARAGWSIPRAEIPPTADRFNIPGGLTYDHNYQRLFVADGRNNRILIFDARPDRLVNGAPAIGVIGQDDFVGNEAGRSSTDLTGPDSVIYDHSKDRLYVSDHGNNRILVFDVHPEQLANRPEAVAVFGQRDFNVHELGPGGPHQTRDPRGLAFDEKHQRLYQTQALSTNMLVWDMPRGKWDIEVLPRSSMRFQSLGVREYDNPDTKFDRNGYAVINMQSGAVAAFTASKEMYDENGSLRTSRVLISQATTELTGPVRRRTIFADGRNNHDTILNVVNTHPAQSADITLVLRDTAGHIVNEVKRRVGGDSRLQVRLSELPGRPETGSLTLTSNIPVSILALGVMENSRQETILAMEPDGNLKQDNQSRYGIPGLRGGGGYRSEIILINDSGSESRGKIHYYNSTGENLQSSGYKIPARGVFILQTPAKTMLAEDGFAVIDNYQGAIPAGWGLVSLWREKLLLSRYLVKPSPVDLSREAQLIWYPVHTLPDPVRHGEQRQYVTIANPDQRKPVVIRFYLHDSFGRERGRYELVLPPLMQKRFDLAHVFNQTRLAKHAVKILTDLPVAVHSHQEVINIRNEVISTEVAGVHEGYLPESEVVLPYFADKAGFATEINLINSSRKSVRGSLVFYTPSGREMDVTLR